MEDYKKEFIEFMVDSHVLKFGEFTLKSGRKSPFFMNAGAYRTGSQLIKLGEYYARAIHDHYGLDFDVLFGPAYKGIPLAVATVMAISKLYGRDIRYCANRKEIKDHGDKGILLGTKLHEGDRVMIIEDVTTSGQSIEETVPILYEQADVDIVGLVVSLNRMEVGKGGKVSALQEIRDRYGFPAYSIVNMKEVTEYLYNRPIDGRVLIDSKMKKALDHYYSEYGVKE
ncbi:MAG: orotate phosphoribosyltransferase [bacterium]